MAEIELSKAPERRGARPSESGTRSRLRSPVDHQRSEFLRRCRARIKPEDVGLPAGRRTRTGGLRREDVAALSGVSASWYTWLEQGRDIRVSDDVLERISNTFRLSDEERTYLFSLVQHRPPRLQNDIQQQPPGDVVRMISALPIPAIAMNLRCDVLTWNAANAEIYRDYGAIPVEERNLLEILFTKPVRHMTPPQLEVMAQRLIGRLRFDYSRCADDPKFEALVHRLLARSALFSRLWRSPEFTMYSYGPHTFTHARFGLLAFEHSSYVPDGHPNIRVVICTPENAAAKKAVAAVTANRVPAPAGGVKQ